MSKGRPVPTLRASANIVSEWKLRQRPQSVISAKWAALWYQRRHIRVQNSSQSYFNRVYFSFYFPAVLYKILRLMLKRPASVRPMFAERLHTSLYKYSNNSHVEQGNRLWWIDVSIYLSTETTSYLILRLYMYTVISWVLILISWSWANTITHHSSPPPPDGYRTSVRSFAKVTFTLAASLLWTGNGYAGRWMHCKSVHIAFTHAQERTHTPPSLLMLQTKEMPIDCWQGQTWEKHYSQEIMPHTPPARLLAGWVKRWWRQRYEGECRVIRKPWW